MKIRPPHNCKIIKFLSESTNCHVFTGCTPDIIYVFCTVKLGQKSTFGPICGLFFILFVRILNDSAWNEIFETPCKRSQEFKSVVNEPEEPLLKVGRDLSWNLEMTQKHLIKIEWCKQAIKYIPQLSIHKFETWDFVAFFPFSLKWCIETHLFCAHWKMICIFFVTIHTKFETLLIL